ncbi:MAG: DUF192 domain-containing protein [Verrucomicrobiota bacterium]
MALERPGRKLILLRQPNILLLCALAICLLISCEDPGKESNKQLEAALPTATLQIGEHELLVECAVTPEQMARGLMFRKSLPENQGMLFFFPEPKQAGFWMKNTLIPLSIAYIDETGKILEIYRMTPHDTESITSRSFRVKYALEMNQGWFEENEIEVGEVITNIPQY